MTKIHLLIRNSAKKPELALVMKNILEVDARPNIQPQLAHADILLYVLFPLIQKIFKFINIINFLIFIVLIPNLV